MLNKNTNATKLHEVVLEGTLVDRALLNKYGFTRPDVDYYLRSGGLLAVKRGLYRRPGAAIKWQGLVYSLREMGFNVHVGGEQAIIEQGFGHFVAMSNVLQIHLYSPQALPKWLLGWEDSLTHSNEPFRLVLHRQSWLGRVGEVFFTHRKYGSLDWSLPFAQVELAVFECLHECVNEAQFQQMDRWFESLSSLSPTKLQHLLTLCPNVKTKRLFGWFTYRHNHAWAKHLDWDKVDIGKGKRSIIKGGSFDKRWQITVPRKMEVQDGSEQSVF